MAVLFCPKCKHNVPLPHHHDCSEMKNTPDEYYNYWGEMQKEKPQMEDTFILVGPTPMGRNPFYDLWMAATYPNDWRPIMTAPPVDLDYKMDLEIDKNDLPGQWEVQPQLYGKWANEYAYAVQVRDRAKDNLDLVRANLDSAIRADPVAHGFATPAKPTEGAITAVILQQEGYGDAMEELHTANLNVNLLTGAKSGMEHKKRALENLTTLLVNEFYQSATTPSAANVAHGKKGQAAQKRKLNADKQ